MSKDWGVRARAEGSRETCVTVRAWPLFLELWEPTTDFQCLQKVELGLEAGVRTWKKPLTLNPQL